MKKTSLYIDPEVDGALARLAAAQGITKAEAIRRSLADTAQKAPRQRMRAIGVGRGPGDVADNVERHLAESDYGER